MGGLSVALHLGYQPDLDYVGEKGRMIARVLLPHVVQIGYQPDLEYVGEKGRWSSSSRAGVQGLSSLGDMYAVRTFSRKIGVFVSSTRTIFLGGLVLSSGPAEFFY